MQNFDDLIISPNTEDIKKNSDTVCKFTKFEETFTQRLFSVEPLIFAESL